MIRWLRALALSFLLLGVSPAIAQQREPVPPRSDAPPPPPPTRPDPRPTQQRPELRDQLLRDLLDVVLQPRRPPPAEVELPQPAPADVVREPTPPIRDAGVPMPVPEPTPPATRVPPSRPATAGPTASVPEPRPAERPVRPASPAQPSPAIVSEPDVAPPPEIPTAAVRPEPPPASPQVSAEPIAPLPVSEPERAPWLLLALAALAVTAALAAAYKLREHRRLARTRAALGLSPSLDPAAGSSSAYGLSLAKPPIAIRTRLEWGAMQNG